MKYYVCVVFCALVSCGMAVVRLVPADYPTIQSAIVASVDQDKVLISEGIYNEDINFLGKDITVCSLYDIDNNPDHITNTIISGTGTGSVVTIASYESQEAVLKGLTIRNGNSSVGGGISIRNSAPVIQSCVVHSNTGLTAAGVLIVNSQATLIKLTICNNNGRGLRIIGGMSTEVNSCIVYFNTGDISPSSSTTFSYCDLETPMAGVGNISTDPLLANPVAGDYSLQPNSLCVNTGSPYLYPDLDGTRTDIGAICYVNDAPSVFGDFTASETRVIATQDHEISFSSRVVAFNCNIIGYLWSFGDGGTSTLAEPSHSFSPGGNYDVILTISTNLQNLEIVKAGYITILKDVSANIPSAFSAADSPYYIGTEQMIHHDIVIEAGVEIFLEDGVNLTIMGSTTAIGTEEDPISIAAFSETGVFGFIHFEDACHLQYCNFTSYGTITIFSMDQESLVDHCRFERAMGNGLLSQSPCVISNCVISACGASGLVANEAAQISNCTITNCQEYGIKLGDNYDPIVMYDVNITDCTLQTGISRGRNLYIGAGHRTTVSGCNISEGYEGIVIMGNGRTLISDCVISDGVQSGIRAYEQAVVGLSGNEIYDTAYAIHLYSPSLAEISSNHLHDNYCGVYVNAAYEEDVSIQGNLICDNSDAGILLLNSSPLISHNTIVHNHRQDASEGVGISCIDASAPRVISNILYDHLYDLSTGFADFLPILSSNIMQYPLPAGVTDEGDNLITNPLFMPGSWYHLSANSPAIDSGNPNPLYYSLLQYDLWGGVRIYDGDNNGSAIIDRGCNEYCPTPVDDDTVPSIAEFVLDIYPNPMQDEVKLHCTAKDANTPYTISIYNIRGQKLKAFGGEDLKGDALLSWDGKDDEGRDVAAGVYIVQVKGKNLSITRRMTVMR